MAGITKVLGPINHNFGVAFDVSSSLSNILICNQGTEDITVEISIGVDGGAGFLIKNTVRMERIHRGHLFLLYHFLFPYLLLFYKRL